MITKEQATNEANRYFHYTGKQQCSKSVGKRGGVTTSTVVARRNGATQVWKTRPDEFRIPVKHGLYEYGEITHQNASDWHLAMECEIEELRRNY